MAKTINWEGTKRKDMTQGELKNMRKEGQIPAIISSRGKESTAVFLNEMDLAKRPYGNFRISLKIKGIKEPFDCFLKTLQYNHTSDKIIHADLQALTVGQSLDIDVPLHFVGEPAGIKKGGQLNIVVDSLSIRTLPKDMPESVEVDVSGLNIGDYLSIEDLKLNEAHELLYPTEGTVAFVAEPKLVAEEELEPSEDSGELPEPEIISEKADD